MRTQEEIVNRMKTIDSFLGFETEVLVTALDYEHAKPFLKPETKLEEWKADTEEELLKAARDYAVFAWGKAEDHRGISANRSVAKLAEWAWLLGRDDVLLAMEKAGYENYGCPKLKAFCEGMGFPVPTDEGLQRMMCGVPCSDHCDNGCGS